MGERAELREEWIGRPPGQRASFVARVAVQPDSLNADHIALYSERGFFAVWPSVLVFVVWRCPREALVDRGE